MSNAYYINFRYRGKDWQIENNNVKNMTEDREEKKKQLEYLKGYRDGVYDSWEVFLKIAKEGYYPQELKIVTKTKSSTAKFQADDEVSRLEAELKSSDIIDADAQPIPIMEEPQVQVVLDMSPGLSYVIEEPKPKRCFELFKRELENDKVGMAVVRKPPSQITEFMGLDIKKIIWLTKTQKNGSHMPVSAIGLGDAGTDEDEDDYEYIGPSQMPKLFSVILDFLSGNPGGVVLLEGTEYLLSHNNFNSVLGFVQSLNEAMVTKHANLIMSLNPEAMDTKQLNMIKRDMS